MRWATAEDGRRSVVKWEVPEPVNPDLRWILPGSSRVRAKVCGNRNLAVGVCNIYGPRSFAGSQ